MKSNATIKLKRANNVQKQKAAKERLQLRPQERRNVVVVAAGNSGEEVAIRWRGLSWQDGYEMPLLQINNDVHGPTPPMVRLPSGEVVEVPIDNRLVMTTGNRRDEIKQYPLLVDRYNRLLRGVPVFETYNQGGRGGHSIPAITAIDYDLHIEPLLTHLSEALRGYRQEAPLQRSQIQRLLHSFVKRKRLANEPLIIVVVGGGSGSSGNAGHYLLPYLIRHLAEEMGIENYEVWGVVLGPRVFRGFTADTERNYYALMRSLEYMTIHGQTRDYINGLRIDRALPPYDRTFLLDDPLAPVSEGRVTDAGLNAFFNRAALSLHLLVQAYDVVASHVANPREGVIKDDHRMRWLSSVSGQMVTVDRVALRLKLMHSIKRGLLSEVVARLEA